MKLVVAAYAAALRYIEMSPCDPDITEEQWEAWKRFQAARAAVPRVPSEGTDDPTQQEE